MDIVGIYTRLSDEDRNKINKGDDSNSIINQKAFLTDYAQQRGWGIYEIYSDDDYSGLDSERPDFNRMIQDAKDGKFNIILCKTQSRFSRELETVAKYLARLFFEWGIRFVAPVSGIDTSDPNFTLSMFFNGIQDETYCSNLSKNIKAVFKYKMKSGQYLGSFAPYGYKKDPNDKYKFVIDEEAAKVVREIFDLYLNGFGTHRIAQILDERGYAKPTLYKKQQGYKFYVPNVSKYTMWGATTITRILRNDVYIGVLTQGKETSASYKSKKRIQLPKEEWIKIPDNHEAIVDKDTFYKVQEILNNKRPASKATGKRHMFATKVRCGDCGGTMVRSSTNVRNKHYVLTEYMYFKCKNYSVSRGKICSSMHRISYPVLEQHVKEQLNQIVTAFLQIPDNCASVVSNLSKLSDSSEVQGERIFKEMKRIEVDVEQKNRALADLFIEKSSGTISADQYQIILQTIEKDAEKLKQRKNNLEEQLKLLQVKKETQANLEDIVKDFQLNGLTQRIVNKAIDYIEIGENPGDARQQTITVHWLF